MYRKTRFVRRERDRALSTSLDSAEKMHEFPHSRDGRITMTGGAGGGPGYGEGVPSEGERTRLIAEISRLLREPMMPDSTRTAGLTLIGWLARRMPGEEAHALGVHEARAQSESRLKRAKKA